MAADETGGFGELLRRYRQSAGLTQEELAGQASLTLRGLSDLERGVRRAPYPETVRLLAGALALDATASAQLLALARRARPLADFRHSPPTFPAPIPVPLSSFVGRQRELDEVRRLVSATRLLTLTGTGGIGKTRIALELGRSQAGNYADGVALVDLAPLADPQLIPQAVASALDLREEPGRLATNTIIDVLRRKRLLLILDNCEHVVEGCANLAHQLLAGCADLRILATSRESLGIDGETLWRVPPLNLPRRR